MDRSAPRLLSQGWAEQGLCSLDDGVWFPERESPNGWAVRKAKAVCRTCPVIAECLAYALAADERYGIWGGMTARERMRLKRLRAESKNGA